MDSGGLNGLYARLHDRKADTPGKLWWHAEALHPAIFRALRMDREENGAVYAALPFRLHRDELGAKILIALPTPPQFDPECYDWLDIETVLEWYPHLNQFKIMGDHTPTTAGRIDPDCAELFADAFAFARAFAERRAQWFVSWQMNIGAKWRAASIEPDLTPGLFLFDKPEKCRLPVHEMPADVIAHGINPTDLNRALLRQAQIPRARAANQMRAVA